MFLITLYIKVDVSDFSTIGKLYFLLIEALIIGNFISEREFIGFLSFTSSK